MKDNINNCQLQALIWKRFWCGCRKTTNYIKSFSAILKQLLVILSLFLHHPLLLLYPVLLKILKLQKERSTLGRWSWKARRFAFPSRQIHIPSRTNKYTWCANWGRTLIRETADKVGEAQVLSYRDEHLMAKLFPHLFPYGKGSWYWQQNALTIGKYHKMRLMHVGRRWANKIIKLRVDQFLKGLGMKKYKWILIGK